MFPIIHTLIKHHGIKSAHITVKTDSQDAMYALVNLIPDLTKITDERHVNALASPIVLTLDEDGLVTETAENLMNSVYQQIVNEPVFDAQHFTDNVKGKPTTAKTSKASAKKNTATPASSKTKATTTPPVDVTPSASDLFDDIDTL